MAAKMLFSSGVESVCAVCRAQIGAREYRAILEIARKPVRACTTCHTIAGDLAGCLRTDPDTGARNFPIAKWEAPEVEQVLRAMIFEARKADKADAQAQRAA